MGSERCHILREGILDVKFPPNTPKRALHKAWRKLWACATVLYPSGRGEPHFVLKFTRESEQKETTQVIKATRDGLRLFRCRSGSRPLRTWAISSTSSLLVYLAAENELETQDWMQAIRDGVWPPIHNVHMDKIYDVSLIDDEKSFTSGILGLYGRLFRTPDGMICIIHPHWQGALLRWKPEDIVDVCLVRKVGDEDSAAGVLKVTLYCTKKDGRTFHFYSNTAKSAVSWFKSKMIESRKPTSEENKEGAYSSNIQPEKLDNFDENMLNSSEYAKIQKKSQTDKDDCTEAHKNKDQNTESLCEDIPSCKTILSNIPSEYLNASISFANKPARKNSMDPNNEIQHPHKEDSDDSEDSSPDVYDHIYEDIIGRTSSVGAYTLYEEIDDDSNEYVPPLPPELPFRPVQKPNSLRLLKLSESVAEALKLAEEPPVLVGNQNSSGILNKVIGKKSKSLQCSPSKERPVHDFAEKLNLIRTSSAPNATSRASSDVLLPSDNRCKIVVREPCLNSSSDGIKFPEDLNFLNKESDSLKNRLSVPNTLEADYIDMR